jgi:hypothetical protein
MLAPFGNQAQQFAAGVPSFFYSFCRKFPNRSPFAAMFFLLSPQKNPSGMNHSVS